jgi:SPP1 gp7 family putative phage head morphogenesis protein
MARESRQTRREEALAERRRLLDAQKTFANAMLQRYLALEDSILEDAAKVVERIRVLRAQGLEPGVALESERERITTLLDDIRDQMQVWADGEMQQLSTEGFNAARMGSTAAVKQVSMLGSFGRANVAALERIVDRYRTLPVTRRYATAGAEAKEAVKQAMFNAVGKGDNPRTVVREIQNALGSTRDHADTIARTWIIDAHRGAGLDYYRSQGTRIGGWEWLCAKNLRTCPVCLAMDGTIHPLDEPFGSHPRCRCTHIPLLDDEFEETPQLTGQQYYDALDYADRVKVVGPLKARLIADGKIELPDLVDEYTDPDYGLSRREKSAKSLLSEGKITQADFSSAWARRNEAP